MLTKILLFSAAAMLASSFSVQDCTFLYKGCTDSGIPLDECTSHWRGCLKSAHQPSQGTPVQSRSTQTPLQSRPTQSSNSDIDNSADGRHLGYSGHARRSYGKIVHLAEFYLICCKFSPVMQNRALKIRRRNHPKS